MDFRSLALQGRCPARWASTILGLFDSVGGKTGGWLSGKPGREGPNPRGRHSFGAGVLGQQLVILRPGDRAGGDGDQHWAVTITARPKSRCREGASARRMGFSSHVRLKTSPQKPAVMIACTPRTKRFKRVRPSIQQAVRAFRVVKRPAAGDQSTDRSVRRTASSYRTTSSWPTTRAIRFGPARTPDSSGGCPVGHTVPVRMSHGRAGHREPGLGSPVWGVGGGRGIEKRQPDRRNSAGAENGRGHCDQPRGDLVSGGQLGGGVESSGGNVYGVDSPASGCQPDGILTQPQPVRDPPGGTPRPRRSATRRPATARGGRFGVLLVPPSTVVVTHRVVSPGSRSKL
ncbi:MAG: hypothetical protein CM1200mP2_04020 [Planctomycetaceae bacterium]|nr:MAG: hypothetical protein CM1200mP2_04020 [Planctomycetaceae bacterium]